MLLSSSLLLYDMKVIILTYLNEENKYSIQWDSHLHVCILIDNLLWDFYDIKSTNIWRLEISCIAKKGNGLWGTFEFHSGVVMFDKKARILPPFIIYVSRVQKNIPENAPK